MFFVRAFTSNCVGDVKLVYHTTNTCCLHGKTKPPCCLSLLSNLTAVSYSSGPVVIATRNDALDSIIDDCPQNRLKDLVFVQNGYLDKYLTSKGLADNTQVLLFLSVPSLGVDPVDGVTSVNPEGLTAATGIHAQAFADKLKSLELKCNVIDSEEYKNGMFEKLM